MAILKGQGEYDKTALKTLSIGAITSIEGTIIFSKMDPYEKQDLINKVYNDSLNRLYLVMPVKYFETFEEESQIVKLSPATFNTLTAYLNYEQQRRDTISYNLLIKVKKIARDFSNAQDYANHWQLLELIKVTTLNKAPYPL